MKLIGKLILAATMPLAVATMDARADQGQCSLNGTYVRADTLANAKSQVLRIYGGNASVADQALQRDDSGLIHLPVKVIGKPVAQTVYKVSAREITPNGLRFFDLVDAKTGTALYSGFNLDCETKQVDHPSIGGWRRI